MNKQKLEMIKDSFDDLGPKLGIAYSNQEMVDESLELQSALARDFEARMQVRIERDRDVMNAIKTVAEEYKLTDTAEYIRLQSNVNELGFTIGSFIKGMNGEKIAKRALKLISFDKDVRVLFNIALEDEDVQAEYDAIVIAPYGIFVIEVKNWATSMVINERGIIQREDGIDITYDLPSRMSVKEGLLREYLGDLFTMDYQGIVLFSDCRTKVIDNYKKIPLSFGGSIVYDIREYGKGKDRIKRDKIDQIAEVLLANHKEQKTISKVDSKAIIDDYASIMVMIEEITEVSKEKETKAENIEKTFQTEIGGEDSKGSTLDFERTESIRDNDGLYWRKFAVSAASFLVATGLSIATSRIWKL